MNIDDQLRMKGLASRPVIPGDYGGGQGPRVSAERFVRARLERDKEEAMRDVDRTLEGNARIKVVGIGGGGRHAGKPRIPPKPPGRAFPPPTPPPPALGSPPPPPKTKHSTKMTPRP